MNEEFNSTFGTPSISRRSFLKLGGLGLLSTLFPSLAPVEANLWISKLLAFQQAFILPGFNGRTLPGFQSNLDPGQQGRVQDGYIYVYNKPSFESERVKTLWRDDVVSITGLTVQEDTPSHNLVWYRISEDGFAHSGSIQPVRTLLNEPQHEIPQGGMLAEVSVPFSDSREGPGLEFDPVYRFYYETTHWAINVTYDRFGEPWYMLLDDKWDQLYYVLARHFRLIPNSELQPISPDIPMALKRIEVHLEDQLVTAFEINQPVFMARAATGGRFRDGNYSTKPGRYLTFHKRPSRHMAAGNLAANGYDLPGVPWICYITESGISFHGTYWHNNFGRPRSHGCINLTPQAARWLYLWTLPSVPPEKQLVYQRGSGTAVDIYEW